MQSLMRSPAGLQENMVRKGGKKAMHGIACNISVLFQSSCGRFLEHSVRLLAAAFLLAALQASASAQPSGALGNWGGPDVPTVTAIAPTSGTTLGGTSVTITGT